jgi:hypothetical protein
MEPNSPVGIATKFRAGRLRYGGSIPSRYRNFTLSHSVQISFGAAPASCIMGTLGWFSGVKAVAT